MAQATTPRRCGTFVVSAAAGSSISVKDPQPVVMRAVSVQRTAPAREARVGHEINMRTQRLGPGEESLPRAIGAQDPALSVVVKVRLHDLVEDLLVHGRIFDWNQRFDPAVQVSRHPIS